jgi:uncharacterized protein (DUF302 family)
MKRATLLGLAALIGALTGVLIMGIRSDPERGLVRLASRHSVLDTVARLDSLLSARGIAVFARIDFSGDAHRAGLSLRPEQLLVFGNPRGGTPLMVAEPTAGIDLPFKVLVWEDTEGRSWLAYNLPDYIIARHGLDAALAKNLAALVPLVEQAAN